MKKYYTINILNKWWNPYQNISKKAMSELINEKSELIINYPKYKYFSLVWLNIDVFTSDELEVNTDTINIIPHYSPKKLYEDR